MQATFHLVISAAVQYGDIDDTQNKLYMRAAPRCTKKKPGVEPNEVALKFNIDIPDSLFRQPMLTINTTISEAKRGDDEIIAKIQEEIADRLSDIKGVSVTITAPEE